MPGFTTMFTVDAMASMVVEPMVVATRRHLVVQHLARDCLPGPEAHTGSLHARHLQSKATALASHITMVLATGLGTETGTGTGNETANETGTVTGNLREQEDPFLEQEQEQTSTHTFRHISMNAWTATSRTAGAETGQNLTPGVEHEVDRLRQRGHLTERGITIRLADRIAIQPLFGESLPRGDTMIATCMMRDILQSAKSH